MNRHSILLKISISFFIAILAITALFIVIEKHEYVNKKEQLREHYHHMAMTVMKWKMGMTPYEELDATLKKNNISYIQDPGLHLKIKSLVNENHSACSLGGFYIYDIDNVRYIVIPPIFGEVLLKDHQPKPIDVSDVWWLYSAFVFIILLLFISITVSLYPLKRLQRQIKHFGEGDSNIDFSSSRKDEIAQVSNEFDKATKKIQSVLEARIVFLRNVTHEFKTPITSGKLALELIGDSKSKNVLNNVFTRLELLLKEFVHIEQLTVTDQMLEKRLYPLSDILDQASDMLFLEPNSIRNNFSTNMIEVNFELFTFVFKNLIDNGLKYSQENDFHIECDDKKIHFISKGKEIDEPLEYYLQPFTKGSEKASQSFGLGLYIVNAILKKHNFFLSYKHLEAYNYFTINK